MATATEFGSLAVAICGTAATFVVARRALGDFSTFGSPTVMAACVAGLAFFGLMSAGPVLLIPFGALALTCLALPFIRFLAREGFFGGRNSDEPPSIPRILRRNSTPTAPELPAEPPATPERQPPAEPETPAETQMPTVSPVRPRSTSSQTKPRILPLAIKPSASKGTKSKAGPARS